MEILDAEHDGDVRHIGLANVLRHIAIEEQKLVVERRISCSLSLNRLTDHRLC